VKLNPLAEWTEDEVWDYVRERDVPYHPLYDRGYTSIGCAPCTRAIAPGEAARAGRWWWETNAPKECGIHCAIESGGLEHELHALIGEGHVRHPVRRRGGEVARRAQACSRWCRTRSRRASPTSWRASPTADRRGRRDALAELLELGLSTGPLAALYGPGGEQARSALFRRLPPGRALTDSTRDLNEALRRSRADARRLACTPSARRVSAFSTDGLRAAPVGQRRALRHRR
jgi:hypothetical protein